MSYFLTRSGAGAHAGTSYELPPVTPFAQMGMHPAPEDLSLPEGARCSFLALKCAVHCKLARGWAQVHAICTTLVFATVSCAQSSTLSHIEPQSCVLLLQFIVNMQKFLADLRVVGHTYAIEPAYNHTAADNTAALSILAARVVHTCLLRAWHSGRISCSARCMKQHTYWPMHDSGPNPKGMRRRAAAAVKLRCQRQQRTAEPALWGPDQQGTLGPWAWPAWRGASRR